LRWFEVDPQEIFTEAAFDPRLPNSKQRVRTERLRQSGFCGPVIEDGAYSMVINLVPMPAAWPCPPDWS